MYLYVHVLGLPKLDRRIRRPGLISYKRTFKSLKAQMRNYS